jgi:Na+/H+ antiporter NhaD/arsenite permease-like protein
MNRTVLVVFALVYVGMVLGRLPRLQIDRTGIALLGTLVLLAVGAVPLEDAKAAIDTPTLGLLFAFMVLSAQLRLGGFYDRVVEGVTALDLSPERLLAAIIVVSGALSAVFTNDVICLAVAPLVIGACERRRLDAVPFLLALACATNVGSAATLIGNPQNILIGQRLGLSFSRYLIDAGVPALLSLAVIWLAVARLYRGRFDAGGRAPVPPAQHGLPIGGPAPPWDAWQTTKGLIVTAVLLVIFLATDWPREIAALAGAGVLLCSRKLHSRRMLGLVDWQLLVLFAGLFVVNHALATTGAPEQAVAALAARGIDARAPGWLFVITVVLSNAVSNVPAVMLLLPLASHPAAGSVLALASTLAGNLFLVGSIANLIVADAAARQGIAIGWREHARVGVPVTIATLAIAAAWLALLH